MDEKQLKELFKLHSKKRIYIVHPSKGDRKRVRNVLREDGISNIVETDDCDEAWEKLKLSPAHVMIFSASTPEGQDFLTQLEESARFPETPVIIFSNKVSEHKKLHSNNEIIAHWIEEPMNGVKVEEALIKVFQGGVIGKSLLVADSLSLEYYSKAVSQFEEGDFESAKDLLRSTLKEKPEFFEAYILMAKSLIEMGDFEAAKRVLGRAATLKAKHPKVLALLTKIASETEEKNKALKVMNMAIERRGEDQMFMIEMGNQAMEKGWVDEAIEFFEKAREIDPNLIHLYNKLGMAHSRAKRYERSLEMYNGALQIDQEDAGIHFNIGMLYFRMANYSDAYDYFVKAGEKDPSLPEPPEWAKKANDAMSA